MAARALALAMAVALAGAAAGARECSVARVEGEGAWLGDGGVWRALPEGSEAALPQARDATLRTGGARVEIRCDDGVVVTVAPGASVRLRGLAAPGGPGSNVVLDLLEGALGVVAPVRDWFRFEVRTPLAIASVRSTEWAVTHGPQGSAVFVRAGAVAVILADGVARLGRGEGVDVAPDGAARPPMPWTAGRVAALGAALGFGWR